MAKLTSCLVVSDLHLNTKSRDSYRWKIWKLLRQTIVKYDIMTVFILGDLTEEKDFHSSHLVNGIVDNLKSLCDTRAGGITHVLRGNHDGIDPNEPYFGFLDSIIGVKYYKEPTIIHPMGKSPAVLMLPHCDSLDDKVVEGNVDYIMAHFTVEGAASESGGKLLGGIPQNKLKLLPRAPILSGDVHKPQYFIDLNLRYVGAPYHVRFGDDFVPRIIVFDSDGKRINVSTSFPYRVKLKICSRQDLDSLNEDKVKKGDQVKVDVVMRPEHMSEWQSWKTRLVDSIKEIGADLVGIEFSIEGGLSTVAADDRALGDGDPDEMIPWRAREALRRYCSDRKLAKSTAAVGMECFEAAEE